MNISVCRQLLNQPSSMDDSEGWLRSTLCKCRKIAAKFVGDQRQLNKQFSQGNVRDSGCVLKTG